MSENDFQFYEKDEFSFFYKYFKTQHVLVSNQGNSQLEAFIFLSFYYIQFISGYFSPQLGILNETNAIDKFLSKIEKITRLKNFFRNNESHYKFACYFFILFLLVCGIYYGLLIFFSQKEVFYDFKLKCVNPYTKFYMYVFYNMILDMGMAHFCLKGNVNRIIINANCSFSHDPLFSFSLLIAFIYVIIINIACQTFNTDSFYLSNSYFAKVDSQYDIIMIFHSFFYSLLLNEHGFSKYFFLIYNFIVSLFIYKYYFYLHLYFEKSIFLLVAIYHSILVWSSFLFLIFYIFPINNLGLIFLITSILVGIYTYSSSVRIDYILMYKTPFNEIKNKYHALYFIKEIIRQINSFDDDEDEGRKTLLFGILEIHKIECPNPECVSKVKTNIYLPKTGEWSLDGIPSIRDKIFLSHFVVSLLNYWLLQNQNFPDMLMNLSLYYLKIIGNVCLSIYTYKQAKKMPMTQMEFFSLMRLKFMIKNHLAQNLKAKNKPVYNLEELDSTLYFKYEELSKNFIQEITNDVNYSLTFWNNLKNNINSINYNEFFLLTEKIRMTKIKITKIFNELFNIYNRANEIFELYLSYIDIINNDYLVKRNLEVIKRKYEKQITDLIKVNYYNILFGKDTGIIIGSGDKGKEGMIITSNKIISELFGYTQEELKGKFINILMPKNLSKIHKSFISTYFEIGEKNFLGKKKIKSFGKDKDNNIFLIKLMLNMFPILNDIVSFVVMITKDKTEDLILIDNYFNIQGISSRLMYKLNIDNKQLFTKYNIPFYAICKHFIGLYKNMSIKKKKKDKNSSSSTPNKKNLDVKKTQSIVQKDFKDKINSESLYQPTTIMDSGISVELMNTFHNNLNQSINNENNNNSINNNKLNPTPTPTPNPDSNYSINKNDNLKNNYQRSFFFRQSYHKINEKPTPIEDIDNLPPPHQLLDTNENIELECEIRIPYFILNFRDSMKNNNNDKDEIDDINVDSIIEEGNEENSNDDSNIEDEEKIPMKDESLKHKNTNSNPSTPISNNNYNNYNFNNEKDNNKNNSNEVIKNKNVNQNIKIEPYKSEEEILFINKINKYKILFLKGNYKELKDYIHICNNEENITLENKFNLIFDKYHFGKKEIAYCIKVFENKEADEFMDDEYDDEEIINNLASHNELKNEIRFDKKQKTESLRKIFSIFPEDRQGVEDLYKEFLKLSNEDSYFKDILIKCKEEIIKNSVCHGNTKQETLMDDENSSQTSQSTYNEDLSKKNRIEEIRNNALKNVSNFYMLKYYTIILIIIIALSITFLIIVLKLFDNLCKNLSEVTNINNKLYQTTNWITFLLSSLISLDTLYNIKNESEYDIQYNTYLDNLTEYVYTLRDLSLNWIEAIGTNFSLVEKAIATFTEESRNLLWEKEEILSYNERFESFEPYPFALFQILTNSKLLLKGNEFISLILNEINVEDNVTLININYQIVMSINNVFKKFLPNNLEKIKELPKILQDFNNNSMTNIRNAIILYGSLMGLFIILYTFTLYKTNKNIDEGFEKVSKIKIEKVEETIKKIEQFNSILKKFIEVNYNENSYYFDTKTILEKEEDSNSHSNNIGVIQNKHSSFSNNSHDGNVRIFNEETNKKNNLLVSELGRKQSLQLFTWSYIQPIFLTIICIQFIVSNLIITKKIISSTNEIIDIQTFLYELVLSASTSLLDLKYTLTYYNIDKNITKITQTSHFSLQVVVTKIAKFDEILNLYNNMQINICDAAFIKNQETDKYNQCLNDSIVKTVNNTNSIFNLIETYCEDLLQLMEYYIETEKNYETKQLYNQTEIKDCEYLYYNYLISFTDNIASATLNNQKKTLNSQRDTAILIYILVVIQISFYSAYIWLIFLKKIIYLLSVARCILRIIPISVIYSTPELANWIENNFNS